MSLAIPYVSEPRPDTGLTNAKLAIWLFLASEVMLFGALFSSYIFLRTGAVDFQTFAYGQADPAAIHAAHDAAAAPAGHSSSPLHASIPLATLNTVILITSSITVVLAWAALVLKDFRKFRLYMGATILLAAGFLLVKSLEYAAKLEHGLVPGFSPLLALYWTMTGLHVVHVLGGIVVNGYHLVFGRRLWESNPAQFTGRIEVSGLYWHFVDLVWIFLFPVLYLL